MRRFLGGFLIAVAGVCAARAAEGPYRVMKAIAIGGPGGWDYITVDPGAHRVYVSHSTHIVVADVESGKIVGDIPDTPGVHGIALAPELGRGFTSNGRDNTSTIVDLKTLAAVGKVETGANPDAILYEPVRQEVYTFNGRGQSATVFGAVTGTVVATIELHGKPEAAAFDRETNRVYVNLEDKAVVAVIDAAAHSLIATWPLTGCEEPTGLAFDSAHHRIFSVCANKVMVAIDSGSGKVLGQAPIGGRADGAAFDPGTGYILSSNGEGTLTVATWRGNGIAVLQTLETQPSARTIALDPQTHQVFLPAAVMGPAVEGQRPQPVPDTFKVLVLGPLAGGASP